MRNRFASIFVPSAFFKIFFCIVIWRFGVDLSHALLLDISVPNLIKSFWPSFSLAIFGFILWYFYKEVGTGHILTPSIEKADLSVAKIIFLFFALLLGLFITHQIILHFTMAGLGNILPILISALGLIGVIILSLLDVSKGMSAFIISLTFFLLVHIAFWELKIFPDDLCYMIINPEILLILSTFIAISFALLKDRKGVFGSKLDIPLAVLTGASIISTFCSYDVTFSLKMIFIGILVPIICYYLMVNSIRSGKELEKVIYALLISFFLISSYSLLYVVREFSWQDLIRGSPYRVDPFFANPNLYGPVLVLFLPLILSLTQIPAISLRMRIFGALVSVMLFLNLLFTFNRGAWVGFPVSIMILLMYSSRIRMLCFKLSPILVLIFLLCKSYFLEVLWARTYSLDYFLQSNPYIGRIAFWKAAIQMIRGNPLTGVGPWMYKEYFRSYELIKFKLWMADAHNLFLQTGAEMGIIGMFALISIFAICLRRSYKILKSAKEPFHKMISLGSFAGLIGFLVVANISGTLLAKYTIDQKYFFAGHNIYLFIFLGLIIVMDKLSTQSQKNGENI